LPLPEGRNLPGQSFLPLLREDKPFAREHVCIFDEYGPVRMIRTERWKYVHRYGYGFNELYDLYNDPDERENIVDVPSQQARVEELRGEMEEWFGRYVEADKDGLKEKDEKEG